VSFVGKKLRSAFNAVKQTVSSFSAQRKVPADISRRQIEEEIPLSWKADNMLWGYVTKYMLKGSGAGFVTPPYTAYWERLWGAVPIEDLPKYKDLYAFTPYIKASVDVTVNLAVSNGFELQGGDDAVREWLTDWLDEQNILQTLRVIATDMLVFGSGYMEVCRNEDTGKIVQLKPLDPAHIRVRRDAYGNVFGYIQLLTMPPVIFTADDIIHFRWGAKSWWYEYSYGTSLLRPLLLIQSLIDQLQNDLSVIIHTYTKPMLVIKAGTPERPFSDTQLSQLVDAFRNRQPATDIFVRGDVTVDVVQSLTKDVNVQFWLDYLLRQREAVLGVPKIFLGESEGANRATAEIVMQEYVTRLRMMQEIIGDMLETDLFKQLIQTEFGEGVEVPHVKWRPIWEPTLQDKAKYLGDLVEKGIILPSEARAQLGFAADFPEGESLPAKPSVSEKKGLKPEDVAGSVVERLRKEGIKSLG
jgi:hypothetical protein